MDKKLEKIKAQAIDLLKEHSLYKKGWTFKYDKAKRRFGQANHADKILSLSKAIVQANYDDYYLEIIIAIKHEIAHILSREKYGYNIQSHGKEWREMCYLLKIPPNPKAPEYLHKPKGYEYECPICKKKITFYRRPKSIHSCYFCCMKYNQGKFSNKFILKPLN